MKGGLIHKLNEGKQIQNENLGRGPDEDRHHSKDLNVPSICSYPPDLDKGALDSEIY